MIDLDEFKNGVYINKNGAIVYDSIWQRRMEALGFDVPALLACVEDRIGRCGGMERR